MSGSQLFLCGDTLLGNLFLAPHFHDKIPKMSVFWWQIWILFFKMKSQNYLATHWMKLVTHKCVAAPHLRTTGLDHRHLTYQNISYDKLAEHDFYLSKPTSSLWSTSKKLKKVSLKISFTTFHSISSTISGSMILCHNICDIFLFSRGVWKEKKKKSFQ